MTNKKLYVLKTKNEHNLNLESKRNLYSEWKTSGLTKSKFCKEKGLALSVFSKECQALSLNKKKRLVGKEWWVPLISESIHKKNKAPDPEVLVEIKLPNGMAFSTSFGLPSLLSLLTDVGHQLQRLDRKSIRR